MKGIRKRICLVASEYHGNWQTDRTRLCAQYARRLALYYDVDVVTTLSFGDAEQGECDYPEKEKGEDGIGVYRFKADRCCNRDTFAALTRELRSNPYHDLEDAAKWLRESESYSSRLMAFIEGKREIYEAFLFFDYSSYSSIGGLALVPEKSILIPIVKNQEELRLCNYYPLLFNAPRGIFYLNQEERKYVNDLFDNSRVANLVAHGGAEIPWIRETVFGNEKHQVPYIACASINADRDERCDQLLKYFAYYKQCYPSDLKLVMIGGGGKQPQVEDIVFTGDVGEMEWWKWLSNARVFVELAQNETSGISMMDAMAAGTPVIVNSCCEALKQHVLMSNAGLYYNGQEEFVLVLHRILCDEPLIREMGLNAEAYVKQKYNWHNVIEKLRFLIDGVIENRIHFTQECKRYEQAAR